MAMYRIMVIDDNATNLSVAKEALSRQYSVIPVKSAKKALALLEKAHPDLILLDVTMPGMDGFEFIRALKRNDGTKNIPVIFLTTLDDGQSELEALGLGAADYIVKPCPVPLLLKRISMHLELSVYIRYLEGAVEQRNRTLRKMRHPVIHSVLDFAKKRHGISPLALH